METNDSLVMDKILECAKQEFLKRGLVGHQRMIFQ